jgi:hypothetical protein
MLRHLQMHQGLSVIFDDKQLIKYIVENQGGDSVSIFKLLEEKFFDVHRTQSRDPTCIHCIELGSEGYSNFAIHVLQEGPGLVSKFAVPENFVCSPPSSDLKEKWSKLASYEKWNDVPADLIPRGFARFTVWNEPAEFIPLDAPSKSEWKEKECGFVRNWEELLLRSAEDERSTVVTASMSADSSSYLADSQGTLSERSTTDSAFTFENDKDDSSNGEDWSHFFL